jgi:hypothetical protein
MIELLSIASAPDFLLYLETGQLPTEFSVAAAAAMCRNLLKRFTNRVVKSRPDLANQLARRGEAVGPSTVGEQDNGNRGIQVNPQRAAAEAQVPDRSR